MQSGRKSHARRGCEWVLEFARSSAAPSGRRGEGARGRGSGGAHGTPSAAAREVRGRHGVGEREMVRSRDELRAARAAAR